MTWEIFKFELKYRWKRPATYIYFAIMFLLPFLAAAWDQLTIGGAAGQIKENAPHNISFMMLIVTAIPGLLLAAGIMGTPIIRDYEHKTSSLFFTTPITKFQYLTGRFLGSFLTALFVFSGIIFGMALGHLSPWVDPDKLLPFSLWNYLHPFIFIALPNLFIMSGIFFMGGALSKKMLVVFTQGVGILVLYIISSQFLSDLDSQTTAALMDPFAVGTHNHVSQYWTVAEKNSQVIPLEGLMLSNRLLWMAVSLLALILTYVFFDFSASKKSKKQKTATKSADEPARIASTTIIPQVTQHDGLATNIKQMFGMSWFYFKWIFKQVPFIAILAAGILIMLSNSQNWGKVYGIFRLPTTYSMLELIQTFNLFFIIIIVMYTGELIWKERDVKMNLIYDALPYPNFVTLAGKFFAMVYMFVTLLFILMVTAITVQAMSGYTDFQIGLYIKTLFSDTLSFLLLFTFLGFLFQSLTNHKFVGHAVFVLFFISTMIFGQLGIEHRMFQFGSTGLGNFSDMNGYGHYLPTFSWFNLYWFGFAGVLFAVALLFSTRGAETGFMMRLKKSRLRLTKPLLTFSLFSLMIFCLLYTSPSPRDRG